MKKVAFILLLAFGVGPAAFAQDVQETEDQLAIRNLIESYVDSFNKRDPEAMASYWAEDGDYIDMSGKTVIGREAIKAEYQKFFATAPEPSVTISLTGLHFVDATTVIEDGVREVTLAPSLPKRIVRYTAVHTKQDGKWVLHSVRDAVAFERTNYELLQGLEWMVGNWVDQADEGKLIESNYRWSEDRNFLIGTFTTTLGPEVLMSATQWIGWDAPNQQIRSWLFDSKGGFAEGTWSKDGDNWLIKSTNHLSNGSIAEQTHVISNPDPNTIQWESTDRKLDGEPLPNTKAVTVIRQEPAPAPATDK